MRAKQVQISEQDMEHITHGPRGPFVVVALLECFRKFGKPETAEDVSAQAVWLQRRAEELSKVKQSGAASRAGRSAGGR